MTKNELEKKIKNMNDEIDYLTRKYKPISKADEKYRDQLVYYYKGCRDAYEYVLDCLEN